MVGVADCFLVGAFKVNAGSPIIEIGLLTPILSSNCFDSGSLTDMLSANLHRNRKLHLPKEVCIGPAPHPYTTYGMFEFLAIKAYVPNNCASRL